MIATWPRKGRPNQPLLYCYETMPGFEYQVAFNLLYAGYVSEGLTLVKSIRNRLDGKSAIRSASLNGQSQRPLHDLPSRYAPPLPFRYSAVGRML